jgi:hypothetical protein
MMIVDSVLIEHPDMFMDGARVLMLKSRHKDGVDQQRTILRHSYSRSEFRRQLEELMAEMGPNERIYASAGARDTSKAIRLFKERQLAADYDGDIMSFYGNLNARWTSCLMDVKSQAAKVWLFDCDSPDDLAETICALGQHYHRELRHQYATKNGYHVIVEPFDRTNLPERVRNLMQDNPIMLWAWS